MQAACQSWLCKRLKLEPSGSVDGHHPQHHELIHFYNAKLRLFKLAQQGEQQLQKHLKSQTTNSASNDGDGNGGHQNNDHHRDHILSSASAAQNGVGDNGNGKLHRNLWQWHLHPIQWNVIIDVVLRFDGQPASLWATGRSADR